MSQILTDQDFANAKRDISDIDKAVNTESIVDPRWGGDFKSLPLISAEFDAKTQDAQSTINLWQEAITQITVDDGVPALAVSTASGSNQQAVNDLGGVDYWAARAYQSNNEVRLTDGTIVISTIDNNSNNPNSNMTGWKKKNSADQIFDESGLSQQEINQYLFPFYSLKKFGVKGDGVTDDRQAIQDAVNFMSSIGGGTLVAPNGEFLLDSKTTETNVNADCLIKWKPNVNLVGLGQATKFKVGGFANSKFYMFYNYTDDLGEVSFENFSIDANGQNNTVTASSGFDQWLIALATANSVNINNVNVSNAAGRQCFSLGTNVLVPTVKSATVRGCSIYKVANDIAGNALQGDHSSVYVSAESAIITGNRFKNDTPGTSVATAIECHSIDAEITGNIVHNYNLGIITAAVVRTVEAHIIHSNIINARVGYKVWCWNAEDILSVVFSNNILVENDTTSQHLIDLSKEVKNSISGTFHVHDNILRGSKRAVSSTGYFGIFVGDIANLSIKGNTFDGLVGRAVSIGTIYSSDVVQIDIIDNNFENCNTTTNADYKDIIAFNAITSIHRLSIKRNSFRSDSSSFSNRIINGTCTVSNFEFEDNTETGAGFTINPSWSAGRFTTSIIHHTTKNEAKPTVPASPTSTWKIITPTGASLREYVRHAGPTATNFWNAIHYVNNAAPSGFDSFQGDRAINMSPAIGRPIEWLCTVVGTPGTWIPSGYTGTPTTTTTALQTIGNAVNTVDKFNTKQVINTTDNKIYYATGPSASDSWKSFDGVTTITPA